MTETKICRVCGKELPLTEFIRSKTCKDGFRNLCRACKGKPCPRMISENLPDGMKRCTKCKEIKPLELFSFHRAKRSGKQSQCKQCHAKTTAAYNARCKQQGIDRSEYYRKWGAANKEKRRESNRKYYSKHSKQSPQSIKRNDITSSEKNREYLTRYYGRKVSLPNDFTFEDWQRALVYFNRCCAVCGRPAGQDHTLSPDHWIAIASPECPGTIITNMVPLCHGIHGCNNSKGKSDPKVWLIRKYGEDEAAKKLAIIEAYFEWVQKQPR